MMIKITDEIRAQGHNGVFDLGMAMAGLIPKFDCAVITCKNSKTGEEGFLVGLFRNDGDELNQFMPVFRIILQDEVNDWLMPDMEGDYLAPESHMRGLTSEQCDMLFNAPKPKDGEKLS
jgi:hypothetical protein